jgi:hypothetical protein
VCVCVCVRVRIAFIHEDALDGERAQE